MSYQQKREFSLLHADVCQALADPKRILILYALSERPRHVTALAEDLGIPQPTASRHLRILRQQSLVTAERDGPSVIYRLADDRVIAVLDLMEQIVFDTLTQRSDLAEAHIGG